MIGINVGSNFELNYFFNFRQKCGKTKPILRFIKILKANITYVCVCIFLVIFVQKFEW